MRELLRARAGRKVEEAAMREPYSFATLLARTGAGLDLREDAPEQPPSLNVHAIGEDALENPRRVVQRPIPEEGPPFVEAEVGLMRRKPCGLPEDLPALLEPRRPG